MTSQQEILRVVFIGCGATLFMDIWLMLLQRLGVPTLNFALIGRWAGHLCRGRFAHAAIGKAAPIPGERWLGWLVHYAVGIAFAGLLVALLGSAWTNNPTWAPAVAVGLATVAAPFFVMQPAMGLGIAASKTPSRLKNRARSAMNHAVFGIGLYLAACLAEWLAR